MNGYIETMWAIHGNHGLYVGTWLTRKEAIVDHVNARLVIPCDKYATIQDGWKELKKKGDRAVKVEIKYTV